MSLLCADVGDVKPFAVALQAVVHEEVEDGVRVDGDQPHGEGEYVVEVVQGKEVAGRMVPVDHQHEEDRDEIEGDRQLIDMWGLLIARQKSCSCKKDLPTTGKFCLRWIS